MPLNIARLLIEGWDARFDKPEQRTRETGYHASSTGQCFRKTILKRHRPDLFEGNLSIESKRIFKMGHIIDGLFKDAMDRHFREGHVFPLSPYQTTSFRDGDFVVYGEADVILLDIDSETLHIVDCKSAANDSWWMKKRDWDSKKEVSPMNAGQVATYMQAEQTKVLMRALGWERIRGWLAYINKDFGECKIVGVPKMALQEAEGYWGTVKQLDEIYRNSGEVPLAVPEASWECGYCDLYPAIKSKDFPNKTAKQKARAPHREANSHMCQALPAQHFAPLRMKEEVNA